MKFFFIGFFLITVPVMARAQRNHYTLETCIDMALKNNLQIALAGNQLERAAIGHRQAWLNMLPDLNAAASHGWFFGRSIDKTTNDYVDKSFYSGNYNLSGGLPVFQGLALQHTVRQAAMNVAATKMSWQQQKDNMTLNMILAYLQLMNFEDLLVQNTEQAALSERQMKRLKDMNDQGAIAPSDFFDIRGQFAGDEASVINVKRDVETAKINICALMNIPYDTAMVFERMPATEVLQKNTIDAATAYNTALEHFAGVQAADYTLKSAGYGLKAARGKLFPSLGFGYGFGSSYTQFNGNIGNQLKNNFGRNLGFSLSIPIFGNLQLRNSVRLAKLDLKDARLQNTSAKTALQQNIQTAYVNMNAAYERYKKLQERVQALQQSYQAAEARFTVGTWNSVEYLTVKNNLDRANVDLIGGKYEYLLRVKIYNYYQGINEP
ncbi:TolC family protein [Niabella aurantiaca]|uniref:TolC family protein n=1 Tax=Niabella aurantiaca TaxID=379900 RepID=UPI0012FC67DE|nr:TolC family protein [Niabella aurantiaca]